MQLKNHVLSKLEKSSYAVAASQKKEKKKKTKNKNLNKKTSAQEFL